MYRVASILLSSLIYGRLLFTAACLPLAFSPMHIMVQNRKTASREKSFILSWTDLMRDTFIAALETQHDLGKRSDTGFIPETWAFYVGEVQKVCLGTETTPIEKAENKLDTRWNDWVWVGRRSGIGRDPETGKYTAADTTWDVTIEKRSRALSYSQAPLDSFAADFIV